MRVFAKLSILLVLLLGLPFWSKNSAHADDLGGNGSVTGIFEGIEVGGTSKKMNKPARKTWLAKEKNKQKDSFNLSTQDTSEADTSQTPVQRREQIVPGIEQGHTKIYESEGSSPAAPANNPKIQEQSEIRTAPADAKEVSAAAGNMAINLNSLIDKVKSTSNSGSANKVPTDGKYSVTNGNKF